MGIYFLSTNNLVLILTLNLRDQILPLKLALKLGHIYFYNRRPMAMRSVWMHYCRAKPIHHVQMSKVAHHFTWLLAEARQGR